MLFARLEALLFTNYYVLRCKNSTIQEKLQSLAPSKVKTLQGCCHLAGMLSLMMLLRLQDDVASTDAGLVGGKVQRIWTGSEVLWPHTDALQHHVGRARGDRGDA